MTENPKQTLAEKVRKNLEHDIISGKYEIGDKIPAEPVLVQQFKVGRNTIREAVQSLIHLGILEAKQGSGTYVIAKSHFGASVIKLCQDVEIEEINEVKSLLAKSILKIIPKKNNEIEIKKMQESFAELKNFFKNNIQDSLKYLEGAKQGNKSKNSKKFKKRDEIFDKISYSVENTYTSRQEIVIDSEITEKIQLLEAQFMTDFAKCSNNKILESIFSALAFNFSTKPNLHEFQNTMKQYEQLVDAITNKNSKAIKKAIDLIFP